MIALAQIDYGYIVSAFQAAYAVGRLVGSRGVRVATLSRVFNKMSERLV